MKKSIQSQGSFARLLSDTGVTLVPCAGITEKTENRKNINSKSTYPTESLICILDPKLLRYHLCPVQAMVQNYSAADILGHDLG